MTIVVAVLATDGVVLAADSMLTVGGGVAHHTGKKIALLNKDTEACAYAGRQDFGQRFWQAVEDVQRAPDNEKSALEYPYQIFASVEQHFARTSMTISNPNDKTNSILAYSYKGTPQCCIFDGLTQPFLLDENTFYIAIGGGLLGAAPFLKFLDDVLFKQKQPDLRQAKLLAAWTVKYTMQTSPAGVAPPLRVVTVEKEGECFRARTHKVGELEVSIRSTEKAIRSSWPKENASSEKDQDLEELKKLSK